MIDRLCNEGRQILIRGELVELRERNLDTAVLKSDGDPTVLVHAFFNYSEFENLAPGTVCEFLGTVDPLVFDETSLWFRGHALEPLR